MGRNRRRRQLIRVELQLKVVFITLLVACLVLLINFQLSLAALWSLDSKIPFAASADVVIGAVRDVLYQKFLLSVGIGVPFAASVGILYSFKFCGPIHRFKLYFAELATGSWRRPCSLRKGDDLQDICQAINHTIDQACDHAEDNHELLQEVGAVLDEIEPSVQDDAISQRIFKIRDRIAREAVVYEKRFAQPLAQPAPQAEDSSPADTTESTATSEDSTEAAEVSQTH